MPAIRIDKAGFSHNPAKVQTTAKTMRLPTSTELAGPNVRPTPEMDVGADIYFPLETSEREAFRTKSGKACELKLFNDA